MSVYVLRESSVHLMNLQSSDLNNIAESSATCVSKSIQLSCSNCYPKFFLENWLKNKNKENFFHWLSCKSNDAFVCFKDESTEVIGILLIENKEHMHLLYVHPLFIGSGIGAALLRSCLEVLSPHKITAYATLNSVNWYLSNGFVLNGKPISEKNIITDFPVLMKRK